MGNQRIKIEKRSAMKYFKNQGPGHWPSHKRSLAGEISDVVPVNPKNGFPQIRHVHNPDYAYYMVCYLGGQCGSWLTWLINQHTSFPKYLVHVKPGDRDVGCYDADVWNNGTEYYTATTPERMLESFRRDNGIPSVTKSCIKVGPNHNLGMRYEKNKYRCAAIDQELYHEIADRFNIKKVIVPVVYKTHYESLLIRASLIFNDPVEIRRKNWKGWPVYIKYKQPYDDRAVYIDIGKLIDGDMGEYQKILDAIEEEPLSNINELITEYKSFINI